MTSPGTTTYEGKEVVTSDDHSLGTVQAQRGEFVLIKTGGLLKHTHAIPLEFLHEEGGVLRTTLSKELVNESPRVSDDDVDVAAVRRHYGLDVPTVTDPDPDGVENAETVGLREGADPAPAQRLGTLGGAGDPTIERSADFDAARIEHSNSADPGWMPGGVVGHHTPMDDRVDELE
ncbi:MAG TPA: hypothetical protein VFA05_08960 [Gaiellaceae bacterium]|nr:hypothetical protein [Gaiellaceae bacterium]